MVAFEASHNQTSMNAFFYRHGAGEAKKVWEGDHHAGDPELSVDEDGKARFWVMLGNFQQRFRFAEPVPALC
jgi:Cu/Zn superoxide dismutase